MFVHYANLNCRQIYITASNILHINKKPQTEIMFSNIFYQASCLINNYQVQLDHHVEWNDKLNSQTPIIKNFIKAIDMRYVT
jgi:hypothetical protein